MMNATELTARDSYALFSACFFLPMQEKVAEKSLLDFVGGGSVSDHLVQAHLAVRNFKKVMSWIAITFTKWMSS